MIINFTADDSCFIEVAKRLLSSVSVGALAAVHSWQPGSNSMAATAFLAHHTTRLKWLLTTLLHSLFLITVHHRVRLYVTVVCFSTAKLAAANHPPASMLTEAKTNTETRMFPRPYVTSSLTYPRNYSTCYLLCPSLLNAGLR
jgi:hypothetical protein